MNENINIPDADRYIDIEYLVIFFKIKIGRNIRYTPKAFFRISDLYLGCTVSVGTSLILLCSYYSFRYIGTLSIFNM